MAINVTVPQLDPAMTEARVVRWLKSEGDFVEKGEPVLEIETSKALVEIEAPIEGIVGPILMAENSVGKVGDVLTCILLPDEAGSLASRKAEAAAPSMSLMDGAVRGSKENMSTAGDGLRVSPYARRLAQEMHVDLTQVRGSGEGGRIVAEDIERLAAESKAEAGSDAHTLPTPNASVGDVPMQGIRAIIAGKMHDSHRDTAPVTLMAEAEASAFVAMRDRLADDNAGTLGFALGYNALLVEVVAQGLCQFPYMNSRLDGDVIRHLGDVHIGVAIDTERGLVVPVIRDADKKSVIDIARELYGLTEKARLGKLMPDELSGGTFTISNLGMYEIEAFTPIINVPEAAILGVGIIRDRPSVADGRVLVSKTMWLSLTFDHRLVDGAPAARFLQHIKRAIADPSLCASH